MEDIDWNKFEWSQEFENVQVSFNLPEETRPKDLNVQFKTKRLIIKLHGKLVIDKELSNTILADDSYWQIEDQKELMIVLEKKSNDFWKNVFVGDKEVDVSDRVPVMKSSQLSGDARKTVQQMYSQMKEK